MKLLFVHHNSDLYGSSRCMLRIASSLVRQGHEVFAILPGAGQLADALVQAGVQCVVQPSLSVIERSTLKSLSSMIRFCANWPRSVREVRAVLRDLQPDVVHTNSAVILSSASAARMCGIPHVWHIREFFTEFPLLWFFHRRRMTSLSNAVLCASGPVADQFGRSPRCRIEVIHDGISPDEFPERTSDAAAAFRKAHDLEDSVVVAVVGRIKLVRKGQETFVDAAQHLLQSHPQAHFLVIGSAYPGNETHEHAIKEKILSLDAGNRVQFLGQVDNMQQAYSAIDILVMASGSPEPFAGVVVEAMAMGIPVVGTDTGGTREQVVDGVTGFLVPPQDPTSMARAIGQLVDSHSLRADMGRRAKERYAECMRLDATVKDTVSVYDDLVQEAGTSERVVTE